MRRINPGISHADVNAYSLWNIHSILVIARSGATKQSIYLDHHALVPRARDDKHECEISGLVGPLCDHLSLLHWPPLIEFAGEPCNGGGLTRREVLVLMRICEEIEKLRT